MKFRVWVYMTLLITACMSSGPVTKDARYYSAHARAFTPPPQYTEWWKDMEECSGKTGDMAKVKFLDYDTTADAIRFDEFSGNALGWWTMFNNTITFVGRNRDMEGVVKHEMLHALLNRLGHPPEYFDTRCSV